MVAASVSDPARFTAVFDRHYDAIAAFLRRRIGPGLADELAAETFLQAFRGRERFDPARAEVRAWLFGIAVNLSRRHLRDEERRLRAFQRAAEPDLIDSPLESVAERLDAAAHAQHLAGALTAMPAGDRETLLLYAWAELSYEEIAAALEIPVGTVRSRLNRARTTLQAEAGRAPARAEERG